MAKLTSQNHSDPSAIPEPQIGSQVSLKPACEIPAQPGGGECAPATINVNGALFNTVVSGGAINVLIQYEDTTPVGTISGGIVLIPNPLCADATVNVNSALFDTVVAGGTINIPVKNTEGTIIGSIVSGEVIAPDVSIKTMLSATPYDTAASGTTYTVRPVSIQAKAGSVIVETISPELSTIIQNLEEITITYDEAGTPATTDVAIQGVSINGASTATNRIYNSQLSGSGVIGAIQSTPQIDAFIANLQTSATANLITAIETQFCTPCADASVTVNSAAFGTVAAGGTLDVPVQYENGTPVGTITLGVVEIPNPVTSTGLYYRRPFYSQKNSYTVAGAIDNAAASYDEGWHLRNGSYDYTPPAYPERFMALDFTAADPYITLASNNSFGNTNRFTAADGTQTFPDSYRVDNLTGLGWWAAEVNGLSNWTSHLAYSATATEGGYSDWRIPTNDELKTIFTESSSGWNSTYFSALTASQLWTSTTNADSLTQAVNTFSTKYFSRAAKTTSYRAILVRNHF